MKRHFKLEQFTNINTIGYRQLTIDDSSIVESLLS